MSLPAAGQGVMPCGPLVATPVSCCRGHGPHAHLLPLADPVEMKLLHMITADPKRTPTFVLFANPDFWLSSRPAMPCSAHEPGGQRAQATAAPGSRPAG